MEKKKPLPMTREEEADEIIRRLQKPLPKRRLEANWTIEAVKDLQSQHGIDLEKELTDALSAEIANEIDREMQRHLERLYGNEKTKRTDRT